MIKVISIIFIMTALAGCAATDNAGGGHPPITPNPAVRVHPIAQATNYDDTNSIYYKQQLSTYYPTGIGMNLNGYGPNANYYEAGFFGNF